MKTYNNLWDEIISFENILLAYRKAAKNKYYRPDVLRFSENLEENLIQIQNELIWSEYKPLKARQIYVRYMDDFIILTQSAEDAHEIEDKISAFVESILGLSINPKSGVIKGSQGIRFCGFIVFATHIKPIKKTLKRKVRHLKKIQKLYKEGKIPIERVSESVMSFIGHYKHCNSSRSVESALDKISL